MAGMIKVSGRIFSKIPEVLLQYRPRSLPIQYSKIICESTSFFWSFNSERSRAQYDNSFWGLAKINIRCFKLSCVSCEEKTVSVPPFPESVTEGDLRWEKRVGDSVEADEVVCEIETDKTSIPVPAPAAGTITELLVQDHSTVKAGQQLFKMQLGPGGASAKAVPKPAAPPPTATPKPETKSTAPSPPQPVSIPPPSKPKPASAPPPIDSKPPAEPKKPPSSAAVSPLLPTQVKIEGSMKVPPGDPTKEISGTRSEFRVKMNRMRLRIAQRLKEAQNTNAMLTTFNELDMSAIINFRKRHQDEFTKKYGIKLGFMSAFLKASAHALQEQPIVNAVIEGTEIVYRDYIDISVAVATPKGLVVPVIRNVEAMSFADIEKAINHFGEKAKSGKLAIEDMDGGTFTISNGGVFGSLLGTPIINPPQSAILGMHATFERPVAIKGEVLIRPMMYIALTYDHRLIDGREAVYFLRKIKAGVEDPSIIVAGL